MIPALFISHSTPRLALDSPWGAEYQQLAQRLPRPRAILVMSAHWETAHLSVGETRDHLQLIYDFYGFPEALYQLKYPAPAAAWLHGAVCQLLNTSLPIVDRGLDHGVWVPLYRMYPEADIPVLQLSLPQNMDAAALFQLGRQLSPLREQGVLLIGSGMLTHNLAVLRMTDRTAARAAALLFDGWVKNALQQADLASLLNWQASPYAQANHPTPEHFLPLLFAAGAGGLEQVTFAMEGFELDAFSRRSVIFGLSCTELVTNLKES